MAAKKKATGKEFATHLGIHTHEDGSVNMILTGAGGSLTIVAHRDPPRFEILDLKTFTPVAGFELKANGETIGWLREESGRVTWVPTNPAPVKVKKTKGRS